MGRVGRIEFNLYGNVFLTRYEDKIKNEEFIKLLQTEVPEEKLYLLSELNDKHKKLIVNCLADGNVEIPKDKFTEKEYTLIRKFTLILLRDIMKDRTGSAVYGAFAPFLTFDILARIKTAFEKSEAKPDDDINASVDQTNRLYSAISQGLCYPELDADGNAKHEDILTFLEKLHYVFKWDKYEKQDDIGNKNRLRWYATMLKQWISGSGLSLIMTSALEHANNRKFTDDPKKVVVDGFPTPYDDSPFHRNLVIGETLSAIESVILFSFSNYFFKFSECYKKKNGIIGDMPNDWYEFVEYGTSNPLSIMLQRHGFSRETALYIRANRSAYVYIVGNTAKLKRIIAKCEKESVRKEVADLLYNAPELFVD